MDTKQWALDRATLIQLAGGMALLLVLGFTAGAAVGYELHGGAPLAGPAPDAQVALTPTTAAQPCTVDDKSQGLRAADANPMEPAPASQPTVATTTGTPDDAEGEASADSAAAGSATRYAVQLGVFGVAGNAERFAARLRSRGYDPLVTAMRSRSGHWLKRVNLSVFPTEDEAVAAAQTFRDREGLPAVVVSVREDQGDEG